MLQKLALMADVLATTGVALGLGGSVFVILLHASLGARALPRVLRAAGTLLAAAAIAALAGEALRVIAYGEFPAETVRTVVFNGSFYARATLAVLAAVWALLLPYLPQHKAAYALFPAAAVWLTLLLALVFGGMVTSYWTWLLWAGALGAVLTGVAPLWRIYCAAPSEDAGVREA